MVTFLETNEDDPPVAVTLVILSSDTIFGFSLQGNSQEINSALYFTDLYDRQYA